MIDSDMLLLLVDSAAQENAPRSELRLHHYTFFAKYEGIQFTYNYQIQQYLYSVGLHQDLKLLLEGRYLTASSDINLTKKGREWLDTLPSSEKEKVEKIAKKVIKTYAQMNELDLFKTAYAKITRGL